MLRRVDVARSQIRREQLVAAEHIDRQETVTVLVAIEETILLVAVYRRVRRIEVEDQHGRRFPPRGDELLHQLAVRQNVSRQRDMSGCGGDGNVYSNVW